MVSVLPDSFERKRAAGDVNRGAQSSNKLVEFGILQGQSDCTEAAHRNSGNRPPRRICREPGFHIRNQVPRYVALEAVFRSRDRIGVVGRFSFGHHQYELFFRKSTDIRVITPFAEVPTASMEQVNNRQPLPTRKNLGKDDPVCVISRSREALLNVTSCILTAEVSRGWSGGVVGFRLHPDKKSSVDARMIFVSVIQTYRD